jgi:hypothetical protein
LVLTLLGLLVLGFITAVRGLWRMTVGGKRPEDTLFCPFCERRTRRAARLCDWCSRDLQSPASTALADLKTFIRQLRQFERNGDVEPQVAAQLVARAEEHQKRLLTPPAVAPMPRPPQPAARPESAPVSAIVVQDPPQAPPVAPAPRPAPVAAFAPRPAVVVPAAVAKPVAPPPPKKGWLERLTEFLDERNIPLAEPIGLLVGAILIIGPSIVLAISFREKLGDIPYFQFGIFAAFSSAVFGAGLYAYHRWRLAAVGLVVLIMGILLVPLDFLALASMTKTWSLWAVAVEGAGLAIFVYLVGQAAKVVTPGRRWLEVLAVVGNSAAVLAVARLDGWIADGGPIALAGAVPVAILAGAIVPCLVGLSRETRLDVPRTMHVFTLLGSAVFSVAVPLGLLIAIGGRHATLPVALQHLAPLVAVAAIPILLTGLAVVRTTSDDAAMGAYRTAATAVALAAIALALAALAMAWPLPSSTLLVGGLDAVVLGYVAWRSRQPVAHAGTMLCTAAVYLLGFHLLAGNIPWSPSASMALDVVRATASASSGTALVGLFAAFAVVGEWLARRNRPIDGRFYTVGSWVVAAVSLLLVSQPLLRAGAPVTLDSVIVYGLFAAGLLAQAARSRRAGPAYVGLALAAGAILWGFHATAVARPELGLWPYITALMIHSATGALAAIALRTASPRFSEKTRGLLRDVYAQPLARTALAASGVALLLLVDDRCWDPLWLAVTLAGVGAVWLAVAALERWPQLATGAQAVWSVAVVAGIAAWLRWRPWDGAATVDFVESRSLVAYGIGLALLGLAWTLVRIATRSSEAARQLIEPGWPSVDYLLRHAVVAAQFLLAAAVLLGPCVQELDKTALAVGSSLPEFPGTIVWLLWGALAATSLAALWQRWDPVELVSGLLVAATAPYLAAWHWAGTEIASASAARWALAGTCLLGSAAIWCRGPLAAIASRLRMQFDAGSRPGHVAQAVWLVCTGLPVLGLTILAASMRLTHVAPGGPAGGWFLGLDPRISYLVPLVLAIATLVGYALRERSAGYSFGAGLVVQMAVVLGYLMTLVARSQPFGTTEFVTAIELATIAAAGWALLWLVAERRGGPWRDATAAGRELMHVQLALCYSGTGLMLVVALGFLALSWDVGPARQWITAAGSAWGWTALVLTTVAAAVRQALRGRSFRPSAAGLVGMSALGLLACTVYALWPEAPEWGYRTLMLGWGMYALLVVAVTWWVASLRTFPGAEGPPQALVRAAAGWVVAAGLAAVLLGLKAAFLHRPSEDILWGAAAVALASMAGATMAVWRRQEGWAFASALGVNLAASLAVWYFQGRYRPGTSDREWWILLAHANAIASAAVALVWLAARKRLYALGDLSIRQGPLLAVQTALGVVVMTLLLAPAVGQVFFQPERLPDWMARLADPAGWVALGIVAVAALGYLTQASPRDALHAVAGLLAGAGALAMCLTVRWDTATSAWPWLGQHVLLVAWAVAGLLLYALAWIVPRVRLAAAVVNPMLVGHWITALGAATVVAAMLHAKADPTGPWWACGAILGVSLSTGLVAMQLRWPGLVYASGLLLNVAAGVLWSHFGTMTFQSFATTQAIALAAAAAIWTLVRPLDREGVPSLAVIDRREPFAHNAAQLGLGLMVLVAGVNVFCDASATAHAMGSLEWIALASVVAALAVCLTDGSARFVLPGFYVAGLAGLGLALDARIVGLASENVEGLPRHLAWLGGLSLSAFALGAPLVALLVVRLEPLWNALRIPGDNDRWRADWFSTAQAGVVGLASALSIWLAIDPGFDGMWRSMSTLGWGRIGGPVAGLLLLLAAVATARFVRRTWVGHEASSDASRLKRNTADTRTDEQSVAPWRQAAMALGVLFLSEIGWAWLAPELDLPWLHRSVVLFVAATVVAFAAGFVPFSRWAEAARRSVPALAALALAALAAVMVQELGYYFAYCERYHGVPMENWAKFVVLAGLGGLVVMAIAFAILPRLDPLKLDDRRRQIYVYLAEFLIFVICLHLKCTLPDLFRLEIMRRFWMLIVLGVAFLGAALAELFERLKMPVLSRPLERTALLLPLAPAIGFFVPVLHAVNEPLRLAGQSPAVWFLGGLFYGILAVTRRKAGFGVLAAVATTVGLEVLWYQLDFGLDRLQLWFIPVGLLILISEFLNRDRLTAGQTAAARYLGLSFIYISSSAEYLPAVGQSVWLPLVLVALSLAGILAGVLFRVRSFLCMGMTFLLLVIATMIYWAYTDLHQTWIFWSCCILAGITILAAVGLYEKRRERMVAALRQFRGWEP